MGAVKQATSNLPFLGNKLADPFMFYEQGRC